MVSRLLQNFASVLKNEEKTLILKLLKVSENSNGRFTAE